MRWVGFKRRVLQLVRRPRRASTRSAARERSSASHTAGRLPGLRASGRLGAGLRSSRGESSLRRYRCVYRRFRRLSQDVSPAGFPRASGRHEMYREGLRTSCESRPIPESCGRHLLGGEADGPSGAAGEPTASYYGVRVNVRKMPLDIGSRERCPLRFGLRGHLLGVLGLGFRRRETPSPSGAAVAASSAAPGG